MHGDVVRSIAVGSWLCSLAACSSSSSPTAPTGADAPVALTAIADSTDWRASTPAAEGVDGTRLTDLVRRIRRGDYGAINSLLVVRNERLIVEEYFNGWTADAAHTQQSVSKSVTSLAA